MLILCTAFISLEFFLLNFTSKNRYRFSTVIHSSVYVAHRNGLHFSQWTFTTLLSSRHAWCYWIRFTEKMGSDRSNGFPNSDNLPVLISRGSYQFRVLWEYYIIGLGVRRHKDEMNLKFSSGCKLLIIPSLECGPICSLWAGTEDWIGRRHRKIPG